MTKKRLSGLDELMIVNPGLPGQDQVLGLGELLLGGDGDIYRLGGPQTAVPLSGLAEFYLGADGTLYRLEGLTSLHAADFGDLTHLEIGYFLGDDGTVYQVIQR